MMLVISTCGRRISSASVSRTGVAHEDIDRQGPIVSIDQRHAEMAEHDRVFGACHAIEQLMRLKRMATERAGRIKPCTGHSWLLECAAPPGAIEFSVLHSFAFHRAIGWPTEHPY